MSSFPPIEPTPGRDPEHGNIPGAGKNEDVNAEFARLIGDNFGLEALQAPAVAPAVAEHVHPGPPVDPKKAARALRDITRRTRNAEKILAKAVPTPGAWYEVKQLRSLNVQDFATLTGNFEACVAEFERMRAQTPPEFAPQSGVGVSEEEANAYFYACSAYMELAVNDSRKYGSAVEVATTALGILPHDLDGMRPMFLVLRGDAQAGLDRLPEALSDFEQGLAECRDEAERLAHADPAELGMLRTVMAAIHRRLFDTEANMGDIVKAELRVRRFQDVARHPEEKATLARMLMDLAQDQHSAAHELGEEHQINPAMSTFGEAAAVFHELDDPVSAALCYQRMGTVFSCVRDEEAALDCFGKALALHEITHDEQWGVTTVCAAFSRMHLGEEEEYRRLMVLAEQRLEAYAHPLDFADFLQQRAGDFWHEGDLDQATAYYHRCLDIHDEHQDPFEPGRSAMCDCEECQGPEGLVAFFNEVTLKRLNAKLGLDS